MDQWDPAYWFLPLAVNPRGFTTGNKVTPFIDGVPYMKDLDTNLKRLVKNGDYFYHTGWETDPDLELTGSGVTLLQQVKGLHPSIWFRALLSDHIPHSNAAFVAHFYPQDRTRPKAQAYLDSRYPFRGSHHQKTCLLGISGTHIAYVGGIDLARSRQDTPLHNNPKLSVGWHDLHCRIEGPAVGQVWDNFKQRWNDRINKPRSTVAFPYEITDPAPQIAPLSDPDATHAVQVNRTLACSYGYSFAPSGDSTVKSARVAAVEKAKYFVYVEDQYCWPSELVNALADAAGRGVKIILVLARYDETRALRGTNSHLRGEAFLRLGAGHSQPNVYPYYLVPASGGEMIFVHSKLLIIDDRFVAIGSPNMNYRSETTDSEIQISIVDTHTEQGAMNGSVNTTTICKFARDLRIQLWMEHLGLSDPKLVDDPILGLAQWPEPAGKVVGHAAYHDAPPQARSIVELIREIANLRTICP